MKRLQKEAILKDLEKKMVLLAGPRQVGKTTVTKSIGEEFQHTVYLNYDRLQDRNIMESEAWLPSTQLLILDEILEALSPKGKIFLVLRSVLCFCFGFTVHPSRDAN